MNNKNIILFVNRAPKSSIESIRRYARKNKQRIRIAVIGDAKKKRRRDKARDRGDDILFSCDLNKPLEIEKTLAPYQKEFLAITCRGESNMASFTKVIPHVPYLKTPTAESILWSTDKTYMRKMFRAYDKKITPKFTVVSGQGKKSIKRIKNRVGFPLMLKPAGLAASLLVSVCYHEEELLANLKKIFRQIKKIYQDNKRESVPKVLVEQMMEGEMYSVDAYVNSRGKVYFCPLVHFTAGQSIGIDDFFCYKRTVPTNLKKESVAKAEEAAKKAIHALGLRSSTAHVELIQTNDGWKIIELGPRIGGFRAEMYRLSHGLDHCLNDILIRIPRKPVIPKKIKGHAAALKFYPKKEGTLVSLRGIRKVRGLKSFANIRTYRKIGERCRYAKHGGKPVCDLVLFSKKRANLLADIRRAEKIMEFKTGERR